MLFGRAKKDFELMKEMGLKRDSFKVVYFGAMGAANAMEYIYEATKRLQNDNDVEFLFMGSGFWEPKLRKMSQEDGLINLHFFGNIAMDRLSKIVNFSDVSLVTFSNLPILSTNSPNKLFDSLSAGKAIIVNSPGWTKTMVEEHHCGVYVDGEDPDDMAEKIRFLKKNTEVLETMGKNARILAETEYDKSILCSKFVNVISALNITGGIAKKPS
ncbi:glycosyltransferase family 4 protein [Maribacter halichondriae]|uniref:glycosyltransferase family 4 protein n=1 Tax=Maribacter halichondriae TaxID=2980554 RepID=UPI00235982C9|nr:glycosyltransferase family 4 protein [Maribacter sp. Hal144]